MTKFSEAIHFVVANTTPEKLGKTKLAKVLFYADLDSYRRTGKAITEAAYVKRDHGPMPRELYPTLKQLQMAGKIVERREDHYGFEQHQFWSLENPDVKALSSSDVATLARYTLAICENFTAVAISEMTHNLAWELARDGEEIPFSAFLIADDLGAPDEKELAEIEAHLGKMEDAHFPAP